MLGINIPVPDFTGVSLRIIDPFTGSLISRVDMLIAAIS